MLGIMFRSVGWNLSSTVSCPVGVCVRACFSFFPSLSPQLSVLPYTVGCKVRHEGKLVGVRVRVCGHTFPTLSLIPAFAVLPYRRVCKVRQSLRF